MASDHTFDGEEMGEDVDNICTVHMISRKIMQDDSKLLVKQCWQNQCSDVLQDYKKLDGSLSNEHGCLVYGSRVVILASLQDQVLDLMHLGHFGMQRMKELARSSVYWLRIDQNIERISRQCTACADFLNRLAKPAIHPCMRPEKP